VYDRPIFHLKFFLRRFVKTMPVSLVKTECSLEINHQCTLSSHTSFNSIQFERVNVGKKSSTYLTLRQKASVCLMHVFKTGLIFVSEAGAYPRGAPIKVYVLWPLVNIRLTDKNIMVTNTCIREHLDFWKLLQSQVAFT
jgi:hypothetical protein